MQAYQAGSEEAFERLVEAYSGAVYGLLTRFLGPSPEREDLVQEVFLRVIRAREHYQPSARFTTWLYRIVFNLAVNQSERARPKAALAGAGPERSALEELEDVRAEDPARDLERLDVASAVRAALAALPEKQRIALILAKYEDLSLAEIAGVLDSSEQAIKSLVHRARESLRARLAPFLREEVP